MSEKEKNIITDFRHFYYKKYNVMLDDEILYMLIRMNELQVAVENKQKHLEQSISELRKEVKTQIAFKTKWDYFVYGLGKYFMLSIMLSSVIIACTVFFYTKYNNEVYQITIKEKPDRVMEIKSVRDSTIYYTPLNKKSK